MYKYITFKLTSAKIMNVKYDVCWDEEFWMQFYLVSAFHSHVHWYLRTVETGSIGDLPLSLTSKDLHACL